MRLRLPHLLVLFALAVPTALAERPGSSEADVDARLQEEEAKLEILNEKLASMKKELAGLDDRQTTLLGELHRLDLQIRVAGDQLELLQLQLKRGYREIDQNLKRIEALEAEIEALKPYLESRSVSLYKLGRLSYVRLLLSVEEPSELTRAYRYISRLAREDGKKMARFLENQRDLEETKAALVGQTERMLATREQLQDTTRTLAKRRTSRKALLEEIRDRREMAGAVVHELESARERLGKLVEALASGETGFSGDAETVYLPLHAFEGEIGWPVAGELGGRFGTQRHPRFQTVTVRNGIEIDAPAGLEVSAVYDGEVVFASWFEGYGKLLIVRHPGNAYSLYGYLADFGVEQGDWVDKGDLLAWVGDTGSLSGPRLYFELRIDGKAVDPEKWLDPSRKLAASR